MNCGFFFCILDQAVNVLLAAFPQAVFCTPVLRAVENGHEFGMMVDGGEMWYCGSEMSLFKGKGDVSAVSGLLTVSRKREKWYGQGSK